MPRITAALIQAAKTERKLGEDIEDITGKLEDLKERQEEIRLSLVARRDVLAEVLGALQRMGLNPPPALLVKPEDALSSVRSAILLGAVVPELREQTEVLLADLKELSRVTASIEAERARLTATVEEQVGEKKRLALLLDEKNKLQDAQEAALAGERAKAAELAGQGRQPEGADRLASRPRSSDVRSAEEKARRAEQERLQREAALAAMPVPEPTGWPGRSLFRAAWSRLRCRSAAAIVRRFGER